MSLYEEIKSTAKLFKLSVVDSVLYLEITEMMGGKVFSRKFSCLGPMS